MTLAQTTNVDGKTVNLTPGMAPTVEIKTEKRKMIAFLLSPLMRMTQEAGREINERGEEKGNDCVFWSRRCARRTWKTYGARDGRSTPRLPAVNHAVKCGS
jgi:hypothetical protein